MPIAMVFAVGFRHAAFLKNIWFKTAFASF